VSAELSALLALERAELLRSRWLWLSAALYAALALLFLGVGLRESSVLGFTGAGRALFSLSHALVYLLPLLALVATGLFVTRAREDGSLELLLSQPVSRARVLAVALAMRWLGLALPLAALFGAVAAGAAALGGAAPWGFLAQALAVCAALLFAFAALGVLLSCLARSSAHALAALLLAWLLGVALLDFGMIGILLRWQLAPQAVLVLAALNPVEAARIALLAGIEPDLATLGPVGFHATQRLGPAGLVALGVGWPLAFGALAFAGALHRFRRDDAV
jgi:ABC-type transport system involved in multi-copper enzyme maturation permease subunit